MNKDERREKFLATILEAAHKYGFVLVNSDHTMMEDRNTLTPDAVKSFDSALLTWDYL